MSKVKKDEQIYTIYPDKNMLAPITDALKSELQNLISESPKKIIIDLSDVEMMDSIGIGVLIATFNSLNKIDSKLEIINVSKNIYNTLITMRLNHYFVIKKK